MAQHDFDIANQSAPNFRSDLNDALEALASLSSGGTAPSTTYANMLWYDTSANILKMRSEADDAWISIGYLDQTANAFRILDDTQVVNTSGTQTGLIGDQATATWETGTATTESLVSPAKVKAAIDANKPSTTATATLSGTAVDFTSLPTGLSRVWVVFKDCSVSTSSMSIQLSTGSTFATSGYNSTYVFNTGVVPRTDMFLTGISTTGFNGVYEFFKIPETDEWVGSLGGAGAQFYTAGGRSPDLGGALDGIRITSITGSAALSGEVVVYYT